ARNPSTTVSISRKAVPWRWRGLYPVSARSSSTHAGVNVRCTCSSTACASALGSGLDGVARVALVFIGSLLVFLVSQPKQRRAVPIYFHHPITLRAKDPGMASEVSRNFLADRLSPTRTRKPEWRDGDGQSKGQEESEKAFSG